MLSIKDVILIEMVEIILFFGEVGVLFLDGNQPYATYKCLLNLLSYFLFNKQLDILFPITLEEENIIILFICISVLIVTYLVWPRR